MTDLVEWLRQQIDQEVALAQRLADRYVWPESIVEEPERPGEPGEPFWPMPSVVVRLEKQPDPDLRSGLELIKMYSPARALREAAAKRAILDAHQHVPAAQQNDGHGYTFGCQTCHADTHCGETMGLGWCDTVRFLAAPYDDRPGYKWALWTGLGQ